jgi:hypothetical protein
MREFSNYGSVQSHLLSAQHREEWLEHGAQGDLVSLLGGYLDTLSLLSQMA